MKSLIALVAGIVCALAFAPFALWPLAPLAIAVLFALWLGDSRARAAWHGWLFGVGLFGAGTSWVYVSLHQYGNLPAWLAAVCVAVLIVLVSLLPAAAGFIQAIGLPNANSPRAKTARVILLMPGVWLRVEWARARVFGGYPWLSGGYAMLDTPLAGFAPLGGIYLVGLIMLTTAGAAWALVFALRRGNFIVAVMLAVIWFGGWQLSGKEWTRVAGDAINVAIIQNNVPLARKWDAARRGQILARYLAQSARHQDADLVVWPEAAAPVYFDQLSQNFHAQIRAHPADFIFGALTRFDADGARRYYNSIAAVGATTAFYHKQHLVPFGEYAPFHSVLAPLIARMNIPVANLSAWRQPQSPLRAAGNLFAASICYEDAFPRVWRAQVASAGMLINLSEDSWFGDSFAPHQRLQMARFRALETGRPMIRAANNGLSSVINWRGEIDDIAPQFQTAVVTSAVRPRAGNTPYLIYGDTPALIIAGVLAMLGWLLAWRARKNHPHRV